MMSWVATAVLAASIAAGAERDWTPEVFDYDRPARLEVADKGEPKGKLPDTRQRELVFRNLRDEEVPVLVTLPPRGKGPWPAVLLLHALGSDRQYISRDLGRALTARGFACVALDLPNHGDRKGKPQELFVDGDPDKTYRNIVGAVMDIRQTVDLIKERKDFDSDKGVPIIGYSLGAWWGVLAGSADRRVSALVLQGSGAGEGVTANTSGQSGRPSGDRTFLLRYPTVRVETAISSFAPRPLLMQNGRADPYISQEHARNLYRLAQPPKELKWYDAGHLLPEKAATDAAEWLKKQR
ncbi:MAG: alpha/beta hydrolase [Planctomycetes bacterium]|nr:alpha/beta hydrolase [Planctomycetota bacterium]